MVIEDKIYTPYFQAFIQHRGLRVGDEIPNHEYINWNSRKWSEWRKMNNIPSHAPLSQDNHRAFEKWLFETVSMEVN